MATELETVSARSLILESIRRGSGAPQFPVRYAYPARTSDVSGLFIDKARASIARVTEIASAEEAPGAIWAIISAAQNTARIHLPPDSRWHELPWHQAPGLNLSTLPPSGEDTSFSAADYGVAETGTLVFVSGPHTPSAWHFLPGREIVLVRKSLIVPRLEDVLARIGRAKIPATMNLITGPSRTADVEQTIELGAHGPREVHILLAG